MSNAKRGDPFFRPCKSTQTTKDQDLSTCTCFSRIHYEKATEIVIPDESKTISYNPAKVSKKTCTRCHSRKETILYELEPYAGSTTQCHKTYNDRGPRNFLASSPTPSSTLDVSLAANNPPQKVSKNDRNLTPKEIMNTWTPGRERLAERLLTPSENYIDVSPRDFSLRKYCPELFLSETEKKEMRTRERELEEFRNSKCPQGNFNSNEVKDLKFHQGWQTVVESAAIPDSCPWSDEDISLCFAEQEEVTDEESNAKLHTPRKRPSKWFKWSCSKLKRDKKPDKK